MFNEDFYLPLYLPLWAGAFSYIENPMSEASLHQGQDQKNKDMMNPTAQEIAVNLTKSHESRSFGLGAISFKPRIYR